MSHTIPDTFKGPATITTKKLAVITEWYLGSLGDADKGDDKYFTFYDMGQADAYASVLHLLHDTVKERRNHNVLSLAVVVGLGVIAYRLYRIDEEKNNDDATTQS